MITAEELVSLGERVGEEILEKSGSDNKAYHVVSSVDDFDYFARGVRNGLRQASCEVRFSCLWPVRPRNSHVDAFAVFKRFHEEEFSREYDLVFAVANIGIESLLESLVIDACVDRGMSRFGRIIVSSCTSHVNAERKSREMVYDYLKKRLEWHTLRVDFQLSTAGYSAPGLGAEPMEIAGFKSWEERSRHLPEEISDYIRSLSPNSGLTL